jgi:hypothetical protein
MSPAVDSGAQANWRQGSVTGPNGEVAYLLLPRAALVFPETSPLSRPLTVAACQAAQKPDQDGVVTQPPPCIGWSSTRSVRPDDISKTGLCDLFPNLSDRLGKIRFRVS